MSNYYKDLYSDLFVYFNKYFYNLEKRKINNFYYQRKPAVTNVVSNRNFVEMRIFSALYLN